MKKIFLTSAICMIVAMPSYADIASDAESATCDSTTIGATENNTDLEALWTAAQYTEPAGQYLLFNNNTVSQHQTCPAGSFCPGFTNQTFADASMGIQTCPTGYTNSASGASSNEQCYRACSGNVTIAHATGVTGNDYYGNGTDTCAPTGCDAGYHVSAGACVANTISITWDPKNGDATTTNQCTYGGSVTLPATPSKPGYVFGGWRVVTTYTSCNQITDETTCGLYAENGCEWGVWEPNKCGQHGCYDAPSESWCTDGCGWTPSCGCSPTFNGVPEPC